LPKYYSKSDEIRRERRNQELWLQGLYIYEALCDVSPLLQAFAKNGTKPHQYPDHPYALTKRERKDDQKLREKRDREKAKRYMEAKMATINKRFEFN
jgi:hypothetical protein